MPPEAELMRPCIESCVCVRTCEPPRCPHHLCQVIVDVEKLNLVLTAKSAIELSFNVRSLGGVLAEIARNLASAQVIVCVFRSDRTDVELSAPRDPLSCCVVSRCRLGSSGDDVAQHSDVEPVPDGLIDIETDRYVK